MQSLLLNTSGQRSICFTHTAFFTLVKTQPNDCCRHRNLREILWAKFCPFRNPLPHLWNFCGHLFCASPVWWVNHLSALEVPAWWASPSSTESHYEIFFFQSYTALTFTLAPLAPPSKICLENGNSCPHMLGPHMVSSAGARQSSLLPTQSLPFSLNHFWKCNSICQASCLLARTNHKKSQAGTITFLLKEQGTLNGPQTNIYPKT